MTDEELPDLGPERTGAPLPEEGVVEDRLGDVGGVRGGGLGGAEFEGGGTASMAAVMELEVPVTIELGRTRMAVEDVLSLGRGSVIQLDRLVGQPIEVFVSDKPFATGEVVVLGEKFGVRILQIHETGPKAAAESV